jgi:outer membrane protein OmpA-like peptidoglycan-associated protein
MARAILFLLIILIFGSAALAMRGCANSSVAVDDSGDVASLKDGSVVAAPDGSITRVLVDWLNDDKAQSRRFEVGGTQFVAGTARLTPAAAGRVGRLAQMLRAYPKVQIRLVGEVDPSGDTLRDQKLSQQRADLAALLLHRAGIDPGRLSAIGEGGTRPLFTTPQRRRLNDRIVLELTKQQ